MSEHPKFDQQVDCTGMICPLPVLRTKKALAQLESGQVLKVIATDQGAEHDIPMFAKQTGNEIIANYVEDDVFLFYLKRR